MACCPTTSIHYMDQCCIPISEETFTQELFHSDFILYGKFEDHYHQKSPPNLLWANELNYIILFMLGPHTSILIYCRVMHFVIGSLRWVGANSSKFVYQLRLPGLITLWFEIYLTWNFTQTHSQFFRFLYTVRCHYNDAVYFVQNPCERHPIARP